MFEAVFEDLKADTLLVKKYGQINLVKFHHPSKAGYRQLNNFAVRGYFLGIVCDRLNHNIFPGKKPKAADPIVKIETPDAPTLKQIMYAQTLAHAGVGVTPDNQLHRAGMEFNNVSVWHKQNQICKSLKWLAD